MLRRRSSTYLGIAAFPLAVLGVHHLRFLLAYGTNTGEVLRAEGHAYLGALGPLLIVLIASAVGAYLGRLADHWRGSEPEWAVRTRRLWLVATLALVAVYSTQETLEGFLATGHPGGLEGVFGNGGLWAVPAAALFAGGLALLMRGHRRVVRAVAAAGATLRRLRRTRPAIDPTPVLLVVARLIAA
ncbi:MAG: hypothetical protein REI11_21705, partial [Patulibacter sp.]|nr:hypothetical protein [Patulibacter sp.]